MDSQPYIDCSRLIRGLIHHPGNDRGRLPQIVINQVIGNIHVAVVRPCSAEWILIKYGSDSAGIAKIKEAIVSRFSDSSTSAFALLGTHSRYPVWMIGQLYFFKKDLPPMLFYLNPA